MAFALSSRFILGTSLLYIISSNQKPTNAFVSHYSSNVMMQKNRRRYYNSNMNYNIIRNKSNDILMRNVLEMSTASDLPTAFEWLAKERDGDVNGPISSIEWFDPLVVVKATSSSNDEEKQIVVLPLYPLDACYLPSKSQQFINNVQGRNIRMMLDVAGDEELLREHGRFCVTLRAGDTGRLARVGTIMRVVELDEQRSYIGELVRIVATCVPEDLVEIKKIENPNVYTKEHRLLDTEDYLNATVEVLKDEHESYHTTSQYEQLCQQLASDYSIVRKFYTNTADGIARGELPPMAIKAISNALPELIYDNFQDKKSFWKVAEEWQTLCNTIREAKRANLRSQVNEITIETAMKKGGMLNLPVHREDLPYTVRTGLNKIEEEAMLDFHSLGMDPILDFQGIISIRCYYNRLCLLSSMISRERKRLEAKALLKSVFR